MEHYILNEAGEPVAEPDLHAWARWIEIRSHRFVAEDEPMAGVRVSTIFLGFDDSLTPGPPGLWSTLIVGGPHDGYEDRYASRADAEAGHAKAVGMATSEAPPAAP